MSQEWREDIKYVRVFVLHSSTGLLKIWKVRSRIFPDSQAEELLRYHKALHRKKGQLVPQCSTLHHSGIDLCGYVSLGTILNAIFRKVFVAGGGWQSLLRLILSGWEFRSLNLNSAKSLMQT